jgi:hypothetical protein
LLEMLNGDENEVGCFSKGEREREMARPIDPPNVQVYNPGERKRRKAHEICSRTAQRA